MMNNTTVIERSLEEYKKSLAWYKKYPKEAGILVVKTLPMLEKEGVSDSISHVNINSVSAIDAKKELEFFFNVLKEDNPKSIGGKLPADDFYYSTEQ